MNNGVRGTVGVQTIGATKAWDGQSTKNKKKSLDEIGATAALGVRVLWDPSPPAPSAAGASVFRDLSGAAGVFYVGTPPPPSPAPPPTVLQTFLFSLGFLLEPQALFSVCPSLPTSRTTSSTPPWGRGGGGRGGTGHGYHTWNTVILDSTSGRGAQGSEGRREGEATNRGGLFQ